MPATLTPAQKTALRRDGFVVARGLVPRKAALEGLARVHHLIGSGALDAAQSGGYGFDFWSAWVGDPALVALYRPIEPLVRSLLGETRPVSDVQLALRFPEGERKTERLGLHIDGTAEGGAIRRFTLLAGVLLSDQPKDGMGNLVMCPGTHDALAKGFAQVPPEDRCAWAEKASRELPVKPVPITGKAGDVVIANHQVLHDKGPNRSPFIRVMAYFRAFAVPDRGQEPLVDPWLEWPGLRK